MDEHRARRRQTPGLGERLVGEQDPLLLSHREGPKTQATGASALGQFLVRGVPVLRGASSLPDLVGEGGGDAGVAEGNHRQVL